MDATVVSLCTLIIPIVALALGRAFLHETVTPMAVAGIATILAGVAVAIVPGWKRAVRRDASSHPALLGSTESSTLVAHVTSTSKLPHETVVPGHQP